MATPVIGFKIPNIVSRLPTRIAAGVGQIIALWSYQESLLTEITCEAAGVGLAEGRIAFRQQRADEQIKMIGDLCAIKGIRISTDMTALGKKLNDAQNRRNLLAHGLWMRNRTAKTVSVMVASGTWPLGQRAERLTKRMIPGEQDIDAQYFANARQQIELTISLCFELHSEIVSARVPSRGKSPSQYPRRVSRETHPQILLLRMRQPRS